MFTMFPLSFVALCTLAHAANNFLDSDVVPSPWVAMQNSLDSGFVDIDDSVTSIARVIVPLWYTMPHDASGRVDLQSLRYLADRYFNQAFNMRLRGFDAHTVMRSSWDTTALDARVPGFTDIALNGGRFSMENAATYIAVLQQIVLDEGSTVVDQLIKRWRKTDSSFSAPKFDSFLDSWVLHWIGGESYDGTCFRTQGSQNHLCFEIPHEDELKALARAQVAAFEFSRRGELRPLSRSTRTYTISDAHVLTRSIAKHFASFYETDCREMRNTLIEMDFMNTGRIPLTKFYNSHGYFGETEEYLRDLGVLDYAASAREAHVIIPNYIQAASNCIVSTSQYHICCPNYCEGILREVENSIGTSEATSEEILAVVGNMTESSSLDEERNPVDRALSLRLSEVASVHGGKVRLHGRLFTQWLHYVFPRDCPFPHKAGTVSTASAMEHAGSIEIEIEDRPSLPDVSEDSISKNSTDWMSQWDEHEELLAGYTQHHGFPWVRDSLYMLVALLFVAVGLGLRGHAPKSPAHQRCDILKSHYV